MSKVQCLKKKEIVYQGGGGCQCLFSKSSLGTWMGPQASAG